MCNHCPEGQGLSPACGSTLNHPPAIACLPCVTGKTYSNDYGPSSCKNCHICSSKENVTKKCTAIENTICSNTCEKGYYYENTTHGCQPCSDCCGDGNDIIMTECVEHDMPPLKQCTIHNAQRCKKEFSTIFTLTGTSYLATTTSSRNKANIGMIVGFLFVGLFIAIAATVLIYREVKHNEEDVERNGRREATDINEPGQGESKSSSFIITIFQFGLTVWVWLCTSQCEPSKSPQINSLGIRFKK
jgi:hypothetical protein